MQWWDKARNDYRTWQDSRQAIVFAILHLSSKEVLIALRASLDVASGPGYVAAVAAQRGTSVIGLDFSSTMVALASRNYPGIEFRQGEAEDLPFPDGSAFILSSVCAAAAKQ